MKSKSLKIAIFHLGFIYSGGGEKLVLQEAFELTKRGHKLQIFTSVVDKKKCFPDLIKKHKIKLFIPFLPTLGKNHESMQILVNCALAPFFSFRFRNYDVILACNQPSSWMAFWVNLFFKVPYVSYLAQPTRFLHRRNVDQETGLIFSKKADHSLSAKLMELCKSFIVFADEVSIRNSNYILSNGEYIQKVLEEIYKIKVISVPSGADGVKSTTNKVIDKPFILLTNRHFPQKRFEYGILAFASLLKDFPDLKLVISGAETDYTLELHALIARTSLTDKVIFTGYLDENKIKRLYKDAEVYIYTAPEEDFGMGVVEAMKYGTPVVAWDAAGPSKVIINNVSGLLARPYDVSDFASKIKLLLKDDKLVKKITKEAKKIALNKYSLNVHVDELEIYLKKAIKV